MESQVPVQSRAQVDQFRLRHKTELVTLVFTDIVGSGKLKAELGDQQALVLIRRHHELVRELLAQFSEGQEISTAGDSFFLIFARPSEGVKFALTLQARLREASNPKDHRVADRIGIHVGEVFVESQGRGDKPRDLFGLQVDMAARVMSLAGADQIMVTRFGFDNARQVLKGEDLEGVGPLSWVSHGPYWFKDVDDTVEICEVAASRSAKLSPPLDSQKARRVVAESELVPGWRPALDQEVPDTNWVLQEKLGEGRFGEVWLGRNRHLGEQRVFKFCFQADLVRSLKREVALFRLLKERAGEQFNIVRLFDVCLEQPPYYLEEEYVEGRDLKQWAQAQGGIQHVPLSTRLGIVVQAADALQAAHEAGIVHRDVKPSNILIRPDARPAPDATGSGWTAPDVPEVKLTDFGIAQVLTPDVLSESREVSQTVYSPAINTSGAQLYQAPELLAGKPASTRSDLYALGVVFYQMLVGDFERPVTTEWAEDVQDPLLRDDLKRCFAGNPRDRFAGTGQLADRIRSLQQRRRSLTEQQEHLAARERAAFRRGIVRTGAVAALIVMVILALAWQVWSNALAKFRQASQIRSTTVRLTVANGLGPANQGDWLSAGLWFSEAFVLDESFHSGGDPEANAATHRARINSLFHRSPSIQQIWFDQANLCGGIDPAGEHVLLGDTNGYRLYSIQTGRAVTPVIGHGQTLASLGANGQQIVTGGGGTNSLFTVWEATSGTRLFDLLEPGNKRPYRGGCRDLQFSPDGRWIAAALLDLEGRIFIWAASDGRLRGVLDYANAAGVGWSKGGFIFAARFDPSGQRIVTTASDNRAVVWEWQTGRPLNILTNHRSWVYSGSFGHQHTNWLVTCSFDRTARLWDLGTGEQLFSVGHEGDAIYDAQLSHNDRLILTGGMDSTVRFWDSETGRLVPPILRDHTRLKQVLWSADDSAVVAVGWDGVTRVWRLRPERPAAERTEADVSDDGRRMLVREKNQVQIQDTHTGVSVATLRAGGETNAYWRFAGDSDHFLCFSAEARPLLGNADPLQVQLWQTAGESPVGASALLNPAWSHLVCAPGGRRLLFFSGDPDGLPTQDLQVWDPASRSNVNSVFFTNEIVTAAAFDRGSSRLMVATCQRAPDVGTLRQLDLDAPLASNVLLRTRQLISHVTFSQDGQWLAASLWDETLAPGKAVVWKVANQGSPFVESAGLAHLDGVLFTAFADSGQMIATASEDQTAKVWSRTNDTWQSSRKPFYCGGEVYSCSFSHNGLWLATANRTPEAQGSRRWSSQVRVWDVANAEPVVLPVPFPDRVTRLAFIANDTRLFVERWLPPAAPERWIVDLPAQDGSANDFLLRAELLSAQRSFLSDPAQHLSQGSAGVLSAEDALARATSVGPLRPLSKEECRQLWSHLAQPIPQAQAPETRPRE